MILAVTVVGTATSILYSEFYRRPLRATFYYLQSVYDLLLVTAVVHLTNGSASPFAALYILVIATSSLLVPKGGGLLVAALGIVLYFTDAVIFLRSPVGVPAVWVQLGVIAIVSLGIRYLSAELRQSGEGKDQLVAALEQTRLHAEDILRNIRSGVVTVDVKGRLLYAN